MSKYNDKNRQQRHGDSRWIEKYAIGELDFKDDETREHRTLYPSDKQWEGFNFVSFGSGSSGNCAFLGNENGGILIDAGVDPEHVYHDLENNGIRIANVKGILLTHDHADHIRYAYKIVRDNKHMRIYCTPRLMGGLLRHRNVSRHIKNYQVSIFKEIPFFLAGMKITAFETSHDAIDNMGFCFEAGGKSFVVATDMGTISERAAHYMRQAHFLMIESNYDQKMLDTGKPCTEFIDESDLGGVDDSALEQMCKNAIEGNPNAVADYKGGKEKALMSLLGNVMKQSRGKADAQAVKAKLIELISD